MRKRVFCSEAVLMAANTPKCVRLVCFGRYLDEYTATELPLFQPYMGPTVTDVPAFKHGALLCLVRCHVVRHVCVTLTVAAVLQALPMTSVACGVAL